MSLSNVYLVKGSTLETIADAIRETTGVTRTLDLLEDIISTVGDLDESVITGTDRTVLNELDFEKISMATAIRHYWVKEIDSEN